MSLGLLATPTVTICKVAKMVFNVAPGNFYLSQYLEYQEANGTSATVEALAGLAGGTDAAFVTTVLTNLGLADDAGAEAFLTSAVAASGRGAALEAAISALDGIAADDATYGAAKTAFDTAVITSVSYSTNTANNSTDTSVLAAAVSAEASSEGLSIALSTGVDKKSGSSNADSFTADNTGSAEQTSVADVLNGGDGEDTLSVFSDGTIGTLPTLNSIEVLTVYDEDTALTLSSAAQDSVTTVNLVRNDGDSAVTLGANAARVNLSDIALNDATANNGMTVNFEAARTEATIGLNKITVGTNTGDEDVNAVGAALKTVNIVAEGTKSSFEQLVLAAATTINVDAAVDLTVTGIETTGTSATLTLAGAGDVDIGALDTGISTVTSTATGATTLAVSDDDQVITLGAGNDIITASTTDSIASSKKLAVDAGDGDGDVIIVGDALDIDSAADAARYTNFELIRTPTSLNMALVPDMGLQIAATGGATTFTNLTAAQGNNIQILGAMNAAGTTIALANTVGTTDTLKIKIGDDTGKSGTAKDADSLTINGVETLNLEAVHGSSATAGTNRTAVVADFTADKLTSINLTGSAFDLENVATTKAVTIDASALTGDGGTTDKGLTAAGSLASGSTITGSDLVDTYTIGASGSTYTGGAGKDSFTATQAIAGGSVITGGDGTDTLTLSDTSATTATTTIADNTFKSVTGVEKVVLSGAIAGSLAWTIGGYASSIASSNSGVLDVTATALASGATADTVTVDASGLGAGNSIKLTLTNTVDVVSGNAGTDTFTGSDGNDEFIIEYDSNAANDTSIVTIDAGKGDDKITFTMGTGTSVPGTITLTGGDGNDTIVGSAEIDTITGGKGSDTMTGGGGADIFVITTATHSNGDGGVIDHIKDFVGGTDQLKTVAATELNSQTIASLASGDFDSIDEINAILNSTNGTSTAKFDGTGEDAALITTSDAKSFIAVDMDASGTFTVADVIVEVTGSTGTIVVGDIIA